MPDTAPRSAVILAAGVGSRLGELTVARPKALLSLRGGDGTFLDRSVRLLRRHGFSPIHVVGGHELAVLERHIARVWAGEQAAGDLAVLDFPAYRQVNNVGTVARVRREFAGGGFLLNSDIVYDDAILASAVRQADAEPGRSFLVVDDACALDEEQMKVAVESGRVVGLSKAMAAADAVGEYIGILYIAPSDAPVFLASATGFVCDGKVGVYYEDALAAVLDRLPVGVCSTGGRPWTEVDTLEDYQRALGIAAAFSRPGA
jgi:choline kinase